LQTCNRVRGDASWKRRIRVESQGEAGRRKSFEGGAVEREKNFTRRKGGRRIAIQQGGKYSPVLDGVNERAKSKKGVRQLSF